MPWRVLSHSGEGSQRHSIENLGEFDEIVLGDWLHVEQMNTSEYWMRLGDADIWVTIDRKTGNAKAIRLREYDQGGPIHVEIEKP